MPKTKKKQNTCKERTSNKWCVCGFKRHSENHDEGEHHKRSLR
jgi:hypothetical protein